MSNPDITIVVCTYNRAARLHDALNSLMYQTTRGQFSYCVLVVDDSSTDATPDVIRDAAARSPIDIRYVWGSGTGIACARNMGIKESSSKWIAFFDDDQVAQPNWLNELFACAIQNDADVVGGSYRLYSPDKEISTLSAICRMMLGETGENGKPHKYGRNTHPGGGNALVRATVFQAVGGFDELTTRGGEDSEFAVRLRGAGLEAWFSPTAIVHHYVPAYRLQESYLLWLSLRFGDNFAYRDFRELGLAKSVLICFARIFQAFFVNAPLMLLAYVTGNTAEVIGRKCLLMRSWAYLRESLYLISPRLFAQKTYFSCLSFRRERTTFATSSTSLQGVMLPDKSPER